jgi:hypothetical protein
MITVENAITMKSEMFVSLRICALQFYGKKFETTIESFELATDLQGSEE